MHAEYAAKLNQSRREHPACIVPTTEAVLDDATIIGLNGAKEFATRPHALLKVFAQVNC